MKYIFSLCLFATMLISSCSSEINCLNGDGATIRFRGFDSSALETIITMMNGKSDTTHLSDVAKTSPGYRFTEYDNINHYIYYSGAKLRAGDAITYTMPNIGKTYIITDVETDGQKSKYRSGFLSAHSSDADKCYSSVVSYRINGVTYTTGKTGPSYSAPDFVEIIVQR